MQAVFCKMENKQPKAFVISFLFISIIFFHLCASYRVITFNFVRDFPSSSDRACTKPSIWREKVNYVDPNKVIEESTEGRQSLPLFLLSGVFYPQGSTVLNIFEMKYRTMMFDVAKTDDTFGYIHVNSKTGEVATIGTLCKVIERQLLEDGRQYIALEGLSRFKVQKITKTLPYMVAEVQQVYMDDPVEDEAAAASLELEVYHALRYYMYLLRKIKSTKSMVISTHTKNFRPELSRVGRDVPGSAVESSTRRSNFTFALANMMQMTVPREAQLLLQTTDVVQRLEAQRRILQEAAQFIADQLVKSGILTEENRQELHRRAYRDDDWNEEIFPPEDIKLDQETKRAKDEWDISNIK